MRRTVFFIWYIVLFITTIYPVILGWTMRQNFNHFSNPKFHTFSRSQTVGPMFLNTKSYLRVLPNNLPIIPASDANFTPEPIIITDKTATILHKVHKRHEPIDDQPELEIEFDEEDYKQSTQRDYNLDYDVEETMSDKYEEAILEAEEGITEEDLLSKKIKQ